MSDFENENLNESEENVNEAAEADFVEETAEAVDDFQNDGSEDDAAEAEPAEEDKNVDEQLVAKVKQAENLLFRRRVSLERAAEEKASQVSELMRALKLLQIKPKMEQKEMADLLGMRLRELDALLADAEKKDLVARVEPEEPDMRKVVVFAEDDAIERAEASERKGDELVPGLGEDDAKQLLSLLDKVIEPLVALGLDAPREDRGSRGGFGGRDDRRDGDRGGNRGGFGDRGGSRGGFGGRDDRGSRGGFGGNRGGFGGRDDRGSRGGYGHDDRGSRGGFGGNRGGYDRGGYGNRDDRGGYRGYRDNR